MNRCSINYPAPARRWRPVSLLAFACAVAAGPVCAQSASTTAAAEKALQEVLQREALARQNAAVPQPGVRQFPASAQRAYLEMLMPPEVLVNGTPERLSPGHRIRGLNNQLVMSGQLAGKKVVVNYVRNAQGQLHDIWILNALEEREERPGSGPIRNFSFESEGKEAKEGKTTQK